MQKTIWPFSGNRVPCKRVRSREGLSLYLFLPPNLIVISPAPSPVTLYCAGTLYEYRVTGVVAVTLGSFRFKVLSGTATVVDRCTAYHQAQDLFVTSKFNNKANTNSSCFGLPRRRNIVFVIFIIITHKDKTRERLLFCSAIFKPLVIILLF